MFFLFVILMAAFPFSFLGFPCGLLYADASNGYYPCDKCDKPFDDFVLWNAHEETCTSSLNIRDADHMEDGDVPFQCDVCGENLPDINSWMSHSQFSCPGKPLIQPSSTEVINIKCPLNEISHGTECSFSSPSRSLLELHMTQAQHPYNCSHETCDSAGVLWKFDHRLHSEHEKLPHRKHSQLQCPSNILSHGALCTFSATSRKELEIHMKKAQHPYPCPHENCASTGIVWQFHFDQYNAHVKTPHGDSAKRKQFDESHQSTTIPATAPLETQRKSANTQTSVDDSEAEETSDEESPDSPRRVDTYHASIEEMVGVRINSTVPTNTDASLTKLALDTASRLWHINMNERVCAVCDEHYALKYMKSLTLTHPDGSLKGSEIFSKMQVYNKLFCFTVFFSNLLP